MIKSALCVCGLAVLLGTTAWSQVTQRVSVSTRGREGNGLSRTPVISADGRFVAFESEASNLVPGDTNACRDIFVRDRMTGVTERVSVATGGAEANASNWTPSISADGRCVAFASLSTNLVPGDTNGAADVFVRDRMSGTTERVSVDSGGVQSDQLSSSTAISADGRYVVFSSNATNLVPGDTNALPDIFVRDRQSGLTERVSVDSAGVQADGPSVISSVSADGRFVAIESSATNLVPADTNGVSDVFVHDRQTGTTERVSVDSSGLQADGGTGLGQISADGRCVVFGGDATNLVPGDTNNHSDVFVRDRQTGTTELVSVDSAGVQGNWESYALWNPASADGRFVAFYSYADNLVPGDTGALLDVFVRDRQIGTTERVSVDSGGTQGNDNSDLGSISADGRYVAFESFATNLIPGDTNAAADIFVRDRSGGTSFTSLCDAGLGGVIACPCANAPSGAGRGCDNSSGTGGAILSAAGGTFLSSDSLVFTTSSEVPTGLALVVQGAVTVPAGVVYGQGIRCVAGALERLFTKSATGGTITAPDFGAGDPTVSSRSGALGDVIQPGGGRWYFVYYRDPVVLGGCSPSSTFNATQSGGVSWSP